MFSHRGHCLPAVGMNRLTCSALLLGLCWRKSPLIRPISSQLLTSVRDGEKIKSGRVMHKESTRSTLHDTKSLQNVCVCLCACPCDWGRFCFACACNWRSNIEQRLLNCSCQNFPQDNPLLPFTHSSWICSSNLCQWIAHSQTRTSNIPPFIACYRSSVGYATWCLFGSPGFQLADIISGATSPSNLVIGPNSRSIVPLTVDYHRFISF